MSVREVREVRAGLCGSVRVRAGRAAVPIGIIAKRKIGGVASVWSQSFTTGNWVLMQGRCTLCHRARLPVCRQESKNRCGEQGRFLQWRRTVCVYRCTESP